MNDNELDDMLNQWETPPVSPSLRNRMHAAFKKQRESRRWFSWFMPAAGRGMFAGVAVGVVVCLLLIAQAFPQVLGPPSPALRVPYLVSYELVSYAEDGSSTVSQVFSYDYKGHEIVLNRIEPGLSGLHWQFVLSLHNFLRRVAPSLVLPAESSERDAAFSERLRSGCGISESGSAVIGREDVLGYKTTVTRTIYSDHGNSRFTEWDAPDLGCFTLKSTYERQRADGSFRLANERRPVTVAMR
jgi:hypothetical protein